jgi:outer membrane protein TolC
LIGKNPGEQSSLLAYSGEFPSLSAEQLIGAPSEVIANRPDVKAAEHSAFSTAYLEKSVQRSVFPKISVSAIFGLQNSNFYNQTGIWQANTNLLMPLLNWGAISAAIKTSKSKHRQALLMYKQSVIEALADVETKIHGKITSKNNLVVQTEALSKARKILELAARAAKAGIISGSEHESARQIFCGQQQQLLLAKKADVLATVALAKALGG